MRTLSILLLALGLAGGTIAAQPRYAIPTLPPPQPSLQPYAPQFAQPTTSDIDARIAAAGEREREANEAQTRLQTEIDELDVRREATRVELHRRARALYRIRRAGMLPVAGGFEALLSHLARVERVERMVRSDLGAIAFLRDRQRALETEIATQREVVASAQAERLTLENEKQRLQQQIQSQQLYAGIFDPSYAPRLPVTTPQPAPAWTRQQPTYGEITVRGATPQAPSGFAAQRGSLALPVSGGAVREAQREDGHGLEFVSPGSGVVAAADGRVAFAQRYAGYGQLVILDHGNDYFTLYGGLAQTALTRGEWVGRGARIGSISSSLFFSVRQGTRSLNARSWVGL